MFEVLRHLMMPDCVLLFLSYPRSPRYARLRPFSEATSFDGAIELAQLIFHLLDYQRYNLGFRRREILHWETKLGRFEIDSNLGSHCFKKPTNNEPEGSKESSE